jgi:hypothetical protein
VKLRIFAPASEEVGVEHRAVRHSRFRAPAAAGVALLAPLVSGCAYFEARGLDLYDSFPASVAYGYGLTLEARVTQFAGFGLGWDENWRYGMDDHRYGPHWWEKERGIPFWRYYRYQDYLEDETRWAGGDRRWWPETHRLRATSLILFPGMSRQGEIADVQTYYTNVPLYIPYPYTLHVPWEWPQWNAWDVANCELGLFLAVGGIRIGVSPLQFLDFTLGLFTVDWAKDDPKDVRAPMWPEYGAEKAFPEQ